MPSLNATAPPGLATQRRVAAPLFFASTVALALVAIARVATDAVAFVGIESASARVPLAGNRGQLRHSQRGSIARNAEFDPFGLGGKLQDTIASLTQDDAYEGPTEEDERMMKEVFSKFDLDKDGILNLVEFNALQVVTEGNDAVYEMDQLVDLLKAIKSEAKDLEKGMPFVDYRNLYASKSLRSAYGTDVTRDYMKVFPGSVGASSSSATPAFKDGDLVKIQGLKGAAELNGMEGSVVPPLESEVQMAQEGRIIVKLDADGERVALKPANIASLA